MSLNIMLNLLLHDFSVLVEGKYWLLILLYLNPTNTYTIFSYRFSNPYCYIVAMGREIFNAYLLWAKLLLFFLS